MFGGRTSRYPCWPVHIEHKIRSRPLHPCACIPINRRPYPGDFCRAFEIEDVQLLAQFRNPALAENQMTPTSPQRHTSTFGSAEVPFGNAVRPARLGVCLQDRPHLPTRLPSASPLQRSMASLIKPGVLAPSTPLGSRPLHLCISNFSINVTSLGFQPFQNGVNAGEAHRSIRLLRSQHGNPAASGPRRSNSSFACTRIASTKAQLKHQSLFSREEKNRGAECPDLDSEIRIFKSTRESQIPLCVLV